MLQNRNRSLGGQPFVHYGKKAKNAPFVQATKQEERPGALRCSLVLPCATKCPLKGPLGTRRPGNMKLESRKNVFTGKTLAGGPPPGRSPGSPRDPEIRILRAEKPPEHRLSSILAPECPQNVPKVSPKCPRTPPEVRQKLPKSAPKVSPTCVLTSCNLRSDILQLAI